MPTPVEQKPKADLRDYLAEERTFLAWIRTGVALMGFGVLLARFGIFADEPRPPQHVLGIQPHELSLWLATALIAVGVTVNLLSARRYMRLISELNHGEFVHRPVSKQGPIVALFLALLGIAVAVYLIPGLAQANT
jgi:putative membrane protein